MNKVDLYQDKIVSGRLALGLEYNGASYHGWQRQAHAPSIQACLEDALEKILCMPITVTCAGRTDAGVHASEQIVHFDTQMLRPLKAYTRGLNTHLPNDIAIKWAKPVQDDFHARYSANARRYRYIIDNYPFRAGILNAGLTHVYEPLDHNLMHEAAQFLIGEQDFTSFRAAHCQSNTPFRCIYDVKVTRINRYIIVDITANAFLHHMVRNIVGSLIKVGNKEQKPNWIAQLLEMKDRTKAAATAKPNGLYLAKVYYPEQFELPLTSIGPLFLHD